MITHKIRAEIDNARPYSEVEGERDTHGLIEMIAQLRHLKDVQEHNGETWGAYTNWSIAKDALYRWAVGCDNQRAFATVSDHVQGRLKNIARRKEQTEWWENEKPSQDHYWHKAREQLATEILEHYSG